VVHLADAGPDAPNVLTDEREHERGHVGGLVQDALHLVAGGPLEGSDVALVALREPAQQLLDAVVGPAAVALVDREHENAVEPRKLSEEY